MKIKVFVVDDHYMVIEGIRSLLQNVENIEWLGHATNAASCHAFLADWQPDVILMDINLPDKSGIDLCREVKEKYPIIKVLGLSTFNQESFIQKILANGANGYLLKNATRDEMLDAITTVMEGRNYLSEEAAETIQKSKENSLLITRRETEVLKLISEGYTNPQMAEKLFVSITTIESHRKSLLAKFNVKNTALLIREAIRLQII